MRCIYTRVESREGNDELLFEVFVCVHAAEMKKKALSFVLLLLLLLLPLLLLQQQQLALLLLSFRPLPPHLLQQQLQFQASRLLAVPAAFAAAAVPSPQPQQQQQQQQ